MKKLLILLIGSILFLQGSIAQGRKSKDKVFTSKRPFIFLNFDDPQRPNVIGGLFGSFDADPTDSNAFVKYTFKKDTNLHNKGYNLYVQYDVDSPKTAFNGLWTKLSNINISDFNAFTITVKGDAKAKFNPFFKIEVKDPKGLISAKVDGITDKWKKIVIPFSEFNGKVDNFDFKHITEFTVVFEDWKFQQKVGAYWLDDIGFIPKKGKKVKFSQIKK